MGSVALGFLATDGGLLYGGDLSLLGKQALAVAVVAVFSFTVAFAIGKALDVTVGFRLTEDDEVGGIDQFSHAESGYDLHASAGSARGGGLTHNAGVVRTSKDEERSVRA